MKFRFFLVMSLVLTPFLDAGENTQPEFLDLIQPAQRSSYLSEDLKDPYLFLGTCSPETQSITVTWQNTRDDSTVYASDSYTLKKFIPGSQSFHYRVHASLKNLGEGTNDYTFTATLKGGRRVTMVRTLYYMRHVGERAKPVVYLYPTEEREVTVTVIPKEGLTVSIPPHNQGWRVRATPEGLITDRNGQSYPYLFWESKDSNPPFMPKSGFSVAREDLEKFFRQKLEFQGLNPKEIRDFLEFWLPLLKDYPWYQLAFTPKEVLDRDVPLNIEPKPDTVIRVYFEYRGMSRDVPLPAQVLPQGQRRGFTVIEWGGRRQ